MSDRTLIFITGSTDGIGKYAALALAQRARLTRGGDADLSRTLRGS